MGFRRHTSLSYQTKTIHIVTGCRPGWMTAFSNDETWKVTTHEGWGGCTCPSTPTLDKVVLILFSVAPLAALSVQGVIFKPLTKLKARRILSMLKSTIFDGAQFSAWLLGIKNIASGSQSVVPGISSIINWEIVLKCKLQPTPWRSTESETLGLKHSDLCFNWPSNWRTPELSYYLPPSSPFCTEASTSPSWWNPSQVKPLITHLQASGWWGDNEQDWLRRVISLKASGFPPYTILLRILITQTAQGERKDWPWPV